MGLFSSSSRSSNTTNITDQRMGIEGGGNAFRAESRGAGNVHIGSDDVAKTAILQSTENLEISSGVISKLYSDFLNLTDKRLERADVNIASGQQLTADLLKKEQESADDRLIKLVIIALAGGVSIYALKAGVIKDIAGAIK